MKNKSSRNNFFSRLEITIEHKLQHLGLLTGFVLTCIVGPLIIVADYIFLPSNYTDIYLQLVGIANTFLAIIIGILLTTYSVVFVVMQLASSQFSPRILRYFLYNDLKTQQFIGLFIGTIGLIILPQVIVAFTGDKDFIITISVTILFAFYCLLIGFPKMITYLSDNMNVTTITNRIKYEVVTEINDLYQDNWNPGDQLMFTRTGGKKSHKSVTVVSEHESGYLESVDHEELIKLYNEIRIKNPELTFEGLYVMPIVGSFILKDTTVLLKIILNEELIDEMANKLKAEFNWLVEKSFKINRYRSYTQDINFGVRKLVDIAIKAISPAVNDPTTCLNCIDQLGEIIRVLSIKKFPSTKSSALYHQNIHINEFNFDEFLDFCFDQIHQWGKYDPIVVKRLILTIKHVLPYVQNPYHLMRMLRQIEDMELNRIYVVLGESRLTKEQIRKVLAEANHFYQTAIEQIDQLEKSGVLHLYENPGASVQDLRSFIISEELNVVNYLREFKSRHEKATDIS